MKGVFAGLSGSVVAVVIAYFVLVHLALQPTCELTRLEGRASPSGRFVSSVFRKDCGATTDFVTAVALHPADEAFSDASQDVVLVMQGVVPIGQTWVTDGEIHLKLPPSVPIYRQIDKWNEIKVMVEQ
jgi:hypothetical protein